MRKNNSAFYVGAVILLIVFAVAIFAPWISPYDPFKMNTPYLRPCREHLLGTNDIGQDILSELIYGSRTSLLIGICSALIVTCVGTGVGMVAGYFGGKIDLIISQIINVAMSLPSLVLTVLLVAYVGASIRNIIISICITSWTSTARIVRSKTLQLSEMPYIKAEKTLQASPAFIIVRHILPNLSDIVFLRAVLEVGGAMLTEAGLSFLGLGVNGQKSWGVILHYAFFRSGIINGYYWWYLPPIICICVTVLGFMLLGYYRPKE